MVEIRQPIKRTSIEKKQKIITAGLKVFSEKGYYNTTTAEIAQIAGVSTGIVYNYFKDKKDILLHSLKQFFETAFAPILDTLKQYKLPFNFDNILREFIPLCLKAHIDNKKAHQEFVSMCMLDQDAGLLLRQMERNAIQCICEYLLSNGIDLPYLTEKTQIAYHIIEEYCHDVMFAKYSQTNFEIMFEEVIKIVKNIYVQ
ncbi:MAG: TetR/AcrR family transcriptional regulator [Clostridiales bacterium]|nr:TetR/AcrR family transcriptional regulator [Clostridiales bacterium]